ncbi:MAG: hypothetical protein ABII23_03640 [bacterium]
MRKKINYLFLVISVSILWASGIPIMAGTLTLQQGVSGYNGCTDTYVNYDSKATNYGSETNFVVKEGC